MMENDNDKDNTLDNILKFESKKKYVAGVTKEEYVVYEKMKQEIRLNKDEARIAELVRGITMAIISTLDQDGFTVDSEEFKDDMMMAMEYIRSACFRQVGLKHMFHEIDNKHDT